jgi:hypothetical protein
MKTLSTLFIAAAFALSMIACGGGSEADAVESQNDGMETTGDETMDDGMGDESMDDGMGDESMDDSVDDGMGDDGEEGGEEI